jgi:hypothetical protein
MASVVAVVVRSSLALAVTSVLALSGAPAARAISFDEACQTFAGKLSAAQASGDKEKAQKIYSQGSKRIASKFNGAICANVKAP